MEEKERSLRECYAYMRYGIVCSKIYKRMTEAKLQKYLAVKAQGGDKRDLKDE